MTFHHSQLVTGHGCHGAYLFKIRKRQSSNCEHCGSGADTAQHTIEYCTAWAELIRSIGRDLSLATLLRCMTGSREAWNAVAKFASTVMNKKEEPERARDREEETGRRGGTRTRNGVSPRRGNSSVDSYEE